MKTTKLKSKVNVEGLDSILTPTIQLDTENNQVSLYSADNASIYYTLDGTEPSASNGTLYSTPFVLYKRRTIKAIAVSGTIQSGSPVITATYDSDENTLGLSSEYNMVIDGVESGNSATISLTEGSHSIVANSQKTKVIVKE